MVKQGINALLGLWLMIAPSILKHSDIAADNSYIIGPVILSFSIIALWDCTRNIIKFNIPLAAWLIIAPFILGYENTYVYINDMLIGSFIVFLSSARYKAKKNYNGGWKALWSNGESN